MVIDLTLRELRVIALVDEVGSFTAAAESLQVAQSSLSRTVLQLERRLRTPLFERTTRRVSPTPEGAQLAQAARAVLTEYDSQTRMFTEFLDGTSGLVRIATLPSLAATLLPPIIAGYRTRRPDVHLDVRDEIHGHITDLLADGDIDLAISVHEAAHAGQCQPLTADRLHAVCEQTHPLMERETVRWSDLNDQPFIAFDPTSSVRRLVDRTLDRAQVRTGPVIEAHSIAAVAGLVKAGLGVTVAPTFVLPLMQFADLAHRPLVDPTVNRQICILAAPRRRQPPAAAEFQQAVHDHFDHLNLDRTTQDTSVLDPGSVWMTGRPR